MIKIVQITDLHINENSDTLLFGLVNTDQTCQKVIDKINLEVHPDYIFATGDLSQDGSIASYLRLQKMLMQLDTKMIYVIPGNHDILDNMLNYLCNEKIVYVNNVQILNYNIIFLNSKKEKEESGLLSNSELAKLTQNLEQYNNIIIIIHHHIIPVGGIIDKFPLENSAELISLIKKYQPKISLVLNGHVHNEYCLKIDNLEFLSAPSTCIQFAKLPTLYFENKKPGFRVIELLSDSYNSYVLHI